MFRFVLLISAAHKNSRESQRHAHNSNHNVTEYNMSPGEAGEEIHLFFYSPKKSLGSIIFPRVLGRKMNHNSENHAC